MGICWCKLPNEGDAYTINMEPEIVPYPNFESFGVPKTVDSRVIDNLVLEMLSLIASFVHNDEESPASLLKLHVIADKEDGWIQVVISMISVIPLNDPFGPSAITIMLDDCALPSKESAIKITKMLNLSTERASNSSMDVRIERNICVVLSCIAERLAGPNSIAMLKEHTIDYLLTFLIKRQEPSVVLFALIALEKFAQTTENRLTVKERLNKLDENPLLVLEKLVDSKHFVWRQVGFCAQWALDNLFIVEGRPLSYETVDMSGINVILNSHDVSEYLKISCNGLEARCDSHSFESVRSTFQVDKGCWYYECLIITPGVMQIGWATKNSHFLNYEGYGIGDDLYSIAYDGCRRLVWHEAQTTSVDREPWRAGDVLGCLIDIAAKEILFYINGQKIAVCKNLFENNKNGFFAAASFMAFQQCQFNFGHKPFKFPPPGRPFSNFNDYGILTDEEKKVVPRRLYLQQLRCSSVREDSCTLCFDDTASCILEPCGHRGFCSVCTSQLNECPMCRAPIVNVRREEV